LESKEHRIKNCNKGAYIWLKIKYCMPQLQISTETMTRMKNIVGMKQVHDGDFMVNEMIDVLEKKIRERR
jgi:hypothetical protein